ncbi:MAG: hypothetical protein KC549_01665 [Myxococcales bacterium]|nr:hypothetical protein [Myxococcales bacterium]
MNNSFAMTTSMDGVSSMIQPAYGGSDDVRRSLLSREFLSAALRLARTAEGKGLKRKEIAVPGRSEA